MLAIDEDEAIRLYGVFKEEKGWLNTLRDGLASKVLLVQLGRNRIERVHNLGYACLAR